MKILIIVFLSLCIISLSLKGQNNLVTNPSFEYCTSCPSGCEPNNGTPGSTTDIVELAYPWKRASNGTADYYNKCDQVQDCKHKCWGGMRTAFEVLEDQPARNGGNAVMGIIPTTIDDGGEFVQGKLIAPLIAGRTYYVGCYAKRFALSNKASDRIGILLSENSNIAPNGAISGSSIESPSSFFITSIDEWTPIVGFYTATGNESFITIGYFHSNPPILQTIPTLCNNSTEHQYYFIDDVFVYEVENPLLYDCASSCNITAGERNPIPTGIHDVHNPWHINNLGNISLLHVIIQNTADQFINGFSEYCLNGIQHPVYWNGKTDGGDECAAADYIATIFVTNDCGTSIFPNINISKQNGPNDAYNQQWTDPLPTFPPCNVSGTKVPIACCSSISDFHLNNTTIFGSEHLEWKIQHNLLISDSPGLMVNLTSNANALFQAGNQVQIGPGFSSAAGAEYEFRIYPCPSMRVANADENSPSHVELISTNNKHTESTTENNLFTILPNPASENARFMYFIKEKSDVKITLYSVLGKEIAVIQEQKEAGSFEINFDAVGLNPGVYFCNFNAKGLQNGKEYSETKKLVKIKTQ